MPEDTPHFPWPACPHCKTVKLNLTDSEHGQCPKCTQWFSR